jgi:hypothetical protein
MAVLQFASTAGEAPKSKVDPGSQRPPGQEMEAA